MANNRNRTRTRPRKRNKKTYRKKYKKVRSYRHMRGGLGENFFSQFATNLRSGITNSFNTFGSKAKEEVKSNIEKVKAQSQQELDKAKAQLKNAGTAVEKKVECLKA
jgi:gas vesicle protein